MLYTINRVGDNMFEKIIEMGILFDFYGGLLNEKQYTAIELYYIHDLTLSEIGEHLKISRQGVHDLLKRSENKLINFEKKLGLANKFFKQFDKMKDILKITNNIINLPDDTKFSYIKKDIEEIKKIALEILEIGQEVK